MRKLAIYLIPVVLLVSLAALANDQHNCDDPEGIPGDKKKWNWKADPSVNDVYVGPAQLNRDYISFGTRREARLLTVNVYPVGWQAGCRQPHLQKLRARRWRLVASDHRFTRPCTIPDNQQTAPQVHYRARQTRRVRSNSNVEIHLSLDARPVGAARHRRREAR